MRCDLPDINRHFHEHAEDYRQGCVVVLIEGSDDLQDIFGANKDYTPVHAAIEAASYIRDTLNPRTRAYFYGDEEGPREIDLCNADTLDNPLLCLPHSRKFVKPALEEVALDHPHHSPRNPLHILLISSGKMDDKFSALYDALLEMLQKPGGQVLLDVFILSRVNKNMQQVVGVAGSRMLFGGKELDPEKPAPNIYLADSLLALQTALTDAINERICPENPEQFVLDKMCRLVREGTRERIVCSGTASFKKHCGM